MDFIKRLLHNLEQHYDTHHNITQNSLERIVTISPLEDGLVCLAIFTPEQWDMALFISKTENKEIQQVVIELSEEGDIATIVIDPQRH